MNKFKPLLALALLCLSLLSQMLYAQQTGQVDRNEWLKQMNVEEQKITAYVEAQMKNTALNESLKKTFLASQKFEEVKETELPNLADNYLRSYYRKKYTEAHPEVVTIYNPGRISLEKTSNVKPGTANAPTSILCDYGDFEAGLLAAGGYVGYECPTSYINGGLCSFIPNSSVVYNNIGFGDPDKFLLTDNIPDPNVPAINQTHNGSKHAVRINGYKRCDAFGLNMLQKSFSSPVSGKAKINFSYALVMQGPHTGSDANGNAFFVARVLDNSGVEVGSRICVPANASGFQTTSLPDCRRTTTVRTLWRDWGCDFLEFDMVANKTYTIEFFVSSCSWQVHYAYAYVDDLCADVTCCNAPPAPTGLKCSPVTDGSNLSWAAVPGASYYKVYINQYDPECCVKSPIPNPVSYIWNVSNTNVIVPTSVATCFSWFVVAMMPDSCSTNFSEKLCSCNPPPPPPVDLGCESLPDGSRLSWNAVPGADHYKIYINQYAPPCCSKSPIPNPISVVWTATGTTIDVPSSFAGCFSWWVVTVMMDGTESGPSATMCSCTPVIPPPTHLACDSLFGASRLSWSPVPGAVSYKVTLNQYDPLCCGAPPIPNPISAIWNVTGTTVDVSDLFASCFSWYVAAVMADGTETVRSEIKCSCASKVPPREDPNPDPDPKGLVAQGATGEVVSDASLYVTAVPNPASDYVDFMVHNTSNPNDITAMTLYLYDLNGKEVIKKEISNNGRLRINVQSYNNGLYVYVIKNSKNLVLFKDKVVIKK